jgi:hypothetical protein
MTIATPTGVGSPPVTRRRSRRRLRTVPVCSFTTLLWSTVLLGLHPVSCRDVWYAFAGQDFAIHTVTLSSKPSNVRTGRAAKTF